MIYSEGGVALHTRSSKYGKLRNGIMISVPPALIKRSKSHIHVFPFGVMAILGLNGYLWVGKPLERITEKDATDDTLLYSNKNEDISDIEMEHIIRVCSCIDRLASKFMNISEKSILDAYQKSQALQLHELSASL